MRVQSILILPLFLLSGCAELSAPLMQTVNVMTQSNGQQLTGVTCELRNNNGRWTVKTPGQLTIPSAFDELVVTCKKDGVGDGVARVESRYKGNVVRDVLSGRGVVAFLDHTTGAAYEYPAELTVIMGNTTQRITAPVASTTVNPNSNSTPSVSTQSPAIVTATPVSGQPSTFAAPVQQVAAKMSLEEAVKKCAELGFIPGTEPSGSCALKLSR